MELENWVNSIHSACAAAFARHRGKTGTLHLLQEEIFRLEKAIETVSLISSSLSDQESDGNRFIPKFRSMCRRSRFMEKVPREVK